MQNLRTRLHTAKSTLRGYTLKRARELEHERFTLQRELSALQTRFLELGLQACTCAHERAAVLQRVRQTRAYLHPQPETSGQPCNLPPKRSETNHEYFIKTNRWSECIISFREFFTPHTRLLEREISALRSELSSTESACQQLEVRASILADMRDEAASELRNVRAQIGSLGMPVADESNSTGNATDMEAPDRRITELEQALQTERAGNAEQLHATAQKLHRTQTEKADLQIGIAEAESRVADLQAQRAQLGDEIKLLNEQLARAEIQHNASVQKNRSLGEQLALARRQQAASREQADVLEKRCSALEKQIAEARRQIGELELSLAEAAYRQEVTDKQNAAHTHSLGQLQERLAQTAADNTRLSQELQSRLDSRAKPENHPVRWTRLAAGFVFLLGILASAGKFWQSADEQPLRVGVSKDIETPVTTADITATKPVEVAPASREKAAIAAMETVDVSPAGGVSRGDLSASGAAQRKQQFRLPFGRNTGGDRTPLTRGAHSRTWIMDQGDSKSARAKACEERGLSADDCAALEKNLLSGSVIRLPGGIQYTVLQNGFGVSPGIDDTVIVNYKGMLLDGQVFDSSMEQGGAVSFRLDEVIAGLQDVLQYMEEGAKWEVYIPGDLAFKKPARYGGQTLVFEIELVSVEQTAKHSGEQAPRDGLRPARSDNQGKSVTDLSATAGDAIPTGSEATGNVTSWHDYAGSVQDFLALNALREDVISLPSGLQYKVLRDGNGSGAWPRATDTVVVHYRGMLPDGSEFDSSYQDGEPVAFQLASVIPGWQEALANMQEGDKWELYIPPSLAQHPGTRKRNFRNLGQQPLIYEIELISVGQTDSADTSTGN